MIETLPLSRIFVPHFRRWPPQGRPPCCTAASLRAFAATHNMKKGRSYRGRSQSSLEKFDL
jgi:hypothetical protein